MGSLGPMGSNRSLRSEEGIQRKRLVGNEKAKRRMSGFMVKGKKEKRPQRYQRGRKSNDSAKGWAHFKNKEVVNLSSGAVFKPDAKLNEAVGHVNQEVIGDLYRSSFTITVGMEFI